MHHLAGSNRFFGARIARLRRLLVNVGPTSSPPIVEREPWPRFGWVVVGAMFLIGFANFPLQVVGTGFDQLPGGMDNRLNNFVLEHGYRYLTGREASFWDAPSFYPCRGATAWSDAHIGMLPMYSALRIAGCSPEQGFQGHFLACFALNFAVCVWALRRLGFGFAGVAAGAYVFTFGLPVVGQISHTQLLPRFLVPPAIVFAWEFLRIPRAWRFAMLAACCIGQLYLTVYIGFHLAIVLAGGLLVTLVRFRNEIPWDELRRPSGREMAKRGVVVFCSVVAILPMLRHGSEDSGTQTAWIRRAAPKPSSWLTAPNISLLAPKTERDIQLGEHDLLFGYLPLAAVIGVVLLGFRPAMMATPRGAAIAAAWTVVLISLFVTRYGPVWAYEPFLHLHGPNRIRIIARVVLVLLFPAGVALAWVVDSIAQFAQRATRLASVLAVVALLSLILLDQWLVPVRAYEAEWDPERYPVATAHAWQAKISGAIASHPDPKLVYVFPSAGLGFHEPLGIQVETMRAAQNMGIPCVNGYTGNMPYRWYYFPNYRALMFWLTEANHTPPERLTGLVVVGWPVPDLDPVYEAVMWTMFPPRLFVYEQK